ncbi:MAG: hypothetical protein P4M15_01540 [Alphaproteobacteria bacterium]|nr:hypothetical protein [Alphaproteobacteria bacterium]
MSISAEEPPISTLPWIAAPAGGTDESLDSIRNVWRQLGHDYAEKLEKSVRVYLGPASRLISHPDGIAFQGELTREAVRATMRFAKQAWDAHCVGNPALSKEAQMWLQEEAKKAGVTVIKPPEERVLERYRSHSGPSLEELRRERWKKEELAEREKQEKQQKLEELNRQIREATSAGAWIAAEREKYRLERSLNKTNERANRPGYDPSRGRGRGGYSR